MSRSVRKPTTLILTRSDTNEAAQLLEMARGLKSCIKVEIFYYPSSENNGADQLVSYREADLRLCFRIYKTLFFHNAAYSTVQGFFTSPLSPPGPFFKAPRGFPSQVRSKSQCLSRCGPGVVPPDTCLIPPRICGGLTMSNNDVIMIDS